MKPHISATLAVLMILLSACASNPNADRTDRSPVSQASPCQLTKNIKFIKDGEGFEDPDQAIKMLSDCLASWPDAPARYRALILKMRSGAYGQQKDYKRAIADREESFRLMPPRDGWEIIGLASSYRDNGQPERAVELLRKIIKDNWRHSGMGTPRGMPRGYHLGGALIHLPQREGAAEAYSEGRSYQQDDV